MKNYLVCVCHELEEVFIMTDDDYEKNDMKELFTIKFSASELEIDKLNFEAKKLAAVHKYKFDSR